MTRGQRSEVRGRRGRLPTEAQTKTLRRIAQTGRMMLTHDADGKDRYSDGGGMTIATPQALILIRNCWVKPENDSLFIGEMPQSWVTLSPKQRSEI